MNCINKVSFILIVFIFLVLIPSARVFANIKAVTTPKATSLYFGIVSTRRIPDADWQKLNRALELVTELPPQGFNPIQLKFYPLSQEQTKIEELARLDYVIHLMDAKEFANQHAYMMVAGGVQFGSRDAGSMILNSSLAGPVTIYLVWEKLVAEENFIGLKKARPEAVALIATELAKEIYANALFLHSQKKRRARLNEAGGQAEPYVLSSQMRARQALTAMRETIQFINRVLTSRAAEITQAEYKEFQLLRENFSRELSQLESHILPTGILGTEIVDIRNFRKCSEWLVK